MATDASHAQIAAAQASPRVTYHVATADESGIRGGAVDLVTVAQALHWFDTAAFFREARRVLVRRGLIAVWCYGLLEIDEAVDVLLRRFYRETVGPYWPVERHLVETGYRTVELPFTELDLPPFVIEKDLTLDQLGGYVRSWSATQRYMTERGLDPVTALIDELRGAWGLPSATRRARWPLIVRAGYVTGQD